jgi:hypothetical protein
LKNYFKNKRCQIAHSMRKIIQIYPEIYENELKSLSCSHSHTLSHSHSHSHTLSHSHSHFPSKTILINISVSHQRVFCCMEDLIMKNVANHMKKYMVNHTQCKKSMHINIYFLLNLSKIQSSTESLVSSICISNYSYVDIISQHSDSLYL